MLKEESLFNAFAFEDWDGDGQSDIIHVTDLDIRQYKQELDRRFIEAESPLQTIVAGMNGYFADFSDMDGDGDLDLIMLSPNWRSGKLQFHVVVEALSIGGRPCVGVCLSHFEPLFHTSHSGKVCQVLRTHWGRVEGTLRWRQSLRQCWGMGIWWATRKQSKLLICNSKHIPGKPSLLPTIQFLFCRPGKCLWRFKLWTNRCRVSPTFNILCYALKKAQRTPQVNLRCRRCRRRRPSWHSARGTAWINQCLSRFGLPTAEFVVTNRGLQLDLVQEMLNIESEGQQDTASKPTKHRLAGNVQLTDLNFMLVVRCWLPRFLPSRRWPVQEDGRWKQSVRGFARRGMRCILETLKHESIANGV